LKSRPSTVSIIIHVAEEGAKVHSRLAFRASFP
jgi:hypothetical protein